MKSFIKNLVRKQLLESMPKELIGNININIPFNKLIIDKLNLEWAIQNIKENRPSRSSDKPMQVAMGSDNKYYLLDGYHRLVEAVLNGKTSTKGILLNKSYEELKSMNKIGVGCAGGSGDEFCSNFKNLGSVEMIKNAFKQINEQIIDGQQMDEATQTICNKMTIGSYGEALHYVEQAMKGVDEATRTRIMQKIHVPLENLKQEQNKINNEVKTAHMSGDSVPDEADTYWTQIQSTICEQGSDFE
jgi:hypothetical protein